MWRKIGKVWLFLFLVLGITSASADVLVKASVDKTKVCAGGSVVYSIVLSGDVRDYSLPDRITIPGVRVYGRGSSQQITFSNGKMTNRITINFVLMPIRTGQVKIPSLKVKVNGKDYYTQEMDLTVEDCGRGGSSTRRLPAQHLQLSGESRLPQGETDTFAVISLNKEKVYVGEPLVVTYTIYTRSRVAYKGFARQPYFEGFVQEEVPPDRDMNRREVVIGGHHYVAADVLRFVLIPTKVGKLVINPGSLLMARTSRMRDVFKDFFSDSFWDSFFDEDFFTTEEQFEVTPAPREVEVLPLPSQGRPKDFTGLVGEFSLSVKVDKDQVKVGDSVTLEVEVKGTGPLSSLDSLDIPISGARVYKSSTSSSMELVNGEPVYVKRFEYLIVPDQPGELVIPEIKLNYFSPKKGTYETVSFPGKTLQVLPGETSRRASLITSSKKLSVKSKGVEKIGEDVRFIKQTFTVESGAFWFWFWIVNLVLAVLWLGLAFRERIATFTIGISSQTRLKSEVERLLSLYNRTGDESALRTALDKLLKLASRKYPDKSDSFRHLAEVFPNLAEVSLEGDALLFGNISLSKEEKDKLVKEVKRVLRLLVLLLVFLGGFFSCFSFASPRDLSDVNFVSGNSAYQAGDYEGAIKEYQNLLKAGVKSFELYYNLGNAYYKKGDLPRALLYYLRAREMRPWDKDLNHNINLVRVQLGISEKKGLLSTISLIPYSFLAVPLAAVFWILLFASLLPMRPVRKFGVVLVSAIALGVILFVFVSKWVYTHKDKFLVLKQEAVYSGPSTKDKEIAILKPGVEVESVGKVGHWIHIKTSDGILGWVKDDAIEKI